MRRPAALLLLALLGPAPALADKAAYAAPPPEGDLVWLPDGSLALVLPSAPGGSDGPVMARAVRVVAAPPDGGALR